MLKQTLTLTDLTLFGVASIMGSGGFNLIGHGVRSGGSWWPMAAALAATLVMGSAWTYASAFSRFKTNTLESDILRTSLGVEAEDIGSLAILVYSIANIVVILVICSHLLLPTGTWVTQTGLTIVILAAMTAIALVGIDVDKAIISPITWGIIGTLLVACGFGLIHRPVPELPPRNFVHSLWIFFFVFIGVESLIKFTEEANDPADIPTALYLSIGISVLLTFGVASAIATWIRLTPQNEGMAVESLFALFVGAWSRTPFTWIILSFLLITAFIVFLATSRYLFGLGEKGGGLALFATTKDNVPWVSILSVFGAGAGAALINNVETLVMITNVGFSVIGGLVAAAACVADWRDGLMGSAIVDGGVATGFVAMLLSGLVPA
jgi:amino acid transporter